MKISNEKLAELYQEPTFKNMSVRFFILDEEGVERECNENDFIVCEYPISYERHTIFNNGVSQICLTKMPIG